MILTGLHFLLTYRCTYECDHCFVWSSPNAPEVTLTLPAIREIYQQALDLGSVTDIYFEGGEPFLYYGTLLQAVREGSQLGFHIGVVSNSYWATSLEDALAWLKPLADAGIADLTVSSDPYHGDEAQARRAANAIHAARELHISVGDIAVEVPPACESYPAQTGSVLMMRGRAASKLTAAMPRRGWQEFTECPYEDLADPGRVHVDPYGYLHVCQGIVMGNIFEQSLTQIVAGYHPEEHPILSPLLKGGPAELARHFDCIVETGYVDACHLCYQVRHALRSKFPALLTPPQMYGEA